MNFLSLKTGDENLDLLFTNGPAKLPSRIFEKKKTAYCPWPERTMYVSSNYLFPCLATTGPSTVKRHKITIEHGRGHVSLPMTYNF